MKSLTTVKLALALIAAILFALSIRMDSNPLRWGAIGFLAAAVLLRFVRRDR